ncbi:MAG: DUF4350 domain-containing protein [Xanthomonadales bacterium]|nr:DUF4350 domain-containing protein [Xanthomonadales bacterium]
MSRTGQVLLSILLLGICVLLFMAAYERRSEEEWQWPSPEARAQPFLAAERLLLAQQLQVEHVDSLTQLQSLGPHVTALVPANRGYPGPAALQAVDDFLANGGHLIIESEPLYQDDPLFDHLGIQRSDPDDEPDFDEDDEAESDDEDDTDFDLDFEYDDWADRYKRPLRPLNPLSPDLLQVDWPGQSAPLVVSSRGGEILSSEHYSDRMLQGWDGVRLLQQRRGSGWLTALNDISFAENWRIGRHDNAEFLWQLLQTGDAERVLFFRARNEGLFVWLRTHAWKVLASVALLLLLAGWQAMPRFGALAADPEPVRRRLGDHLLASGRFLWSHGERRRLLTRALLHARSEMYRHQPHLRLLDPMAQAQHLVERWSVPPAAAQAIVSGDAQATDAIPFVQMLRACRQLHLRLRPALASSAVEAPDE